MEKKIRRFWKAGSKVNEGFKSWKVTPWIAIENHVLISSKIKKKRKKMFYKEKKRERRTKRKALFIILLGLQIRSISFLVI